MQRRQFLHAAAAVAGVAAGDVPGAEIRSQQDRLLQLADRDDDVRWGYEITCNLAHVRSGLLNAELDALCEEPIGVVETLAVGRSCIPLDFEVSTDSNESVGILVHLSAGQAEALAVDLLEQAYRRGVMMNNTGLTVRIVRAEDGVAYHEYEVAGVAYGSLDALKAARRCSLTFKSEKVMKLVHHSD